MREWTNERTIYTGRAIKRRNYKYAENCKHTQTTSVYLAAAQKSDERVHEIWTWNTCEYQNTTQNDATPLYSCWYGFYFLPIPADSYSVPTHLPSPINLQCLACDVVCKLKKVSGRNEKSKETAKRRKNRKKKWNSTDFVLSSYKGFKHKLYSCDTHKNHLTTIDGTNDTESAITSLYRF